MQHLGSCPPGRAPGGTGHRCHQAGGCLRSQTGDSSEQAGSEFGEVSGEEQQGLTLGLCLFNIPVKDLERSSSSIPVLCMSPRRKRRRDPGARRADKGKGWSWAAALQHSGRRWGRLPGQGCERRSGRSTGREPSRASRAPPAPSVAHCMCGLLCIEGSCRQGVGGRGTKPLRALYARSLREPSWQGAVPAQPREHRENKRQRAPTG